MHGNRFLEVKNCVMTSIIESGGKYVKMFSNVCDIFEEDGTTLLTQLLRKQAQRQAAASRSRHKSQGEFSTRGRIFSHNAQNGFSLFSSF